MIAIFIISGILWVGIGFVLMVMAGLTHGFEDRHFSPAWMLLLGPLGWPAWQWAEKREADRG